MDQKDKKAALAAYREIEKSTGVFAIHAHPLGQSWVGFSTDLPAMKRRLWFEFRLGAVKPVALQKAWKDTGGEAFEFETLEVLPKDTLPVARSRMLKEKRSLWCDRLEAAMI